jgi:predicted kinase
VAADSPIELHERERLRQGQPQSGLEQRLARLTDGHPSGEGYGDGGGGRRPERIRPLTDAEYADHIKYVEAKLEAARAAGLATHERHTVDRGNQVWAAKRELEHNAIVDYFHEASRNVPRECRAIVAGGLPGAGKTTVLRDHAGIDLSHYFVINPDDIKEELARRGMIPALDGLSPMEASELVHEESSHVAKRLAQRALGDGKNLIWDITMSSGLSTAKRLDELRAARFDFVAAIFVDIPLPVSVQRADARHREGHEQYRNGEGLGGRFVPAQLIWAQANPDWGSNNRQNFEDLKGRFDAWAAYDNSMSGHPPVLTESKAWTRNLGGV